MIGNTVGAKQEQKLLVLFSANDWHHHVLLFVLAGKMNCGTQSYILCPASFVAGRLQPNSIHHYDHKKTRYVVLEKQKIDTEHERMDEWITTMIHQ